MGEGETEIRSTVPQAPGSAHDLSHDLSHNLSQDVSDPWHRMEGLALANAAWR